MTTLSSRKKLVKSKSGLRIVSTDDTDHSIFELTEPQWASDKDSPQCKSCQVRFDFLTRRHHCRRCGLVFCNKCCLQKLVLPRMCFVDPVRLCDYCAKNTLRENEFYTLHLKALMSGANFSLEESGQGRDTLHSRSFFCRLSSNHQEILFDGGGVDHHDALLLSNIATIKRIKIEDFQNESDTGGVELFYGEGDQKSNMKLRVPSVPNPKQSAFWIGALLKALKILKDMKQQELI